MEIRKAMFRKKTNNGDLAKYYIEFAKNEIHNAVIISKYVLVDKSIENKDVINRLEKIYKGKFLYKQIISLTKETYFEIASALLKVEQ